MGRQCRSLEATLRIGSLDEGEESLDHEATWLLGHTDRISFGKLRALGDDLVVEAVLHVPCRFLSESGRRARCTAHGFEGEAPDDRPRRAQPRHFEDGRFRLVERQRVVTQRLRSPRSGLPVLNGDNPCEGTPCRTADNRRGAACCRDLEIEILTPAADRDFETLVRTRKSPYLCKVERTGDRSLDAEVISACGYLAPGGVACRLHGLLRPDGRPGKPDLCSEWPPKWQTLHPGCAFTQRGSLRKRRSG